MADIKTTLEFTTVGGEKVQVDLAAVRDGLNSVGIQSSQLNKKLFETINYQDKLTVSNEDLSSVLNKVAPGLGEMFQTVQRGSRILGELAGKNLKLTETFTILKNAVAANTGSIKLLLAGGAVAAGIYAIQQALAAQAAEHDRVTKAMERQKKAADDLENKRRDLQQTIEDVSDQRPEGGLQGQQSQAAIDSAQRIREKFPFLKEDAVGTVTGLFGGSSFADGGGSFQEEQLAQLSFLQQTGRLGIDPSKSVESRRRAADRALQRFAPQISTALGRETSQSASDLDRAKIEANSGGSPSVNLRNLAERFAPAGTDPDEVVKEVQRFGTLSELEEYEKTPRQSIKPGAAKFLDKYLGISPDDMGVRVANTEVMATARAVLTELQSLNRNIANQKPTVNNTYTAPRMFFGDKGPPSNGQTVTRDAGIR